MKKATSKDVAKLAGVSQTTVSFVLNNTPGISLAESTRRRVHAAAKQLNYIPNAFAQGLKTNQSKLLSVFLPTMDNPFYPTLMQHIEYYAMSLGYNVLMCCTYRDPDREKAYLDLSIEKQVDGIIYTFTPNWLKRVVQLSRQCPVLLLSEKSDDVPLNTISLNGFQCGELAAKHLLDNGHKKLAMLLSPLTSISRTRDMRLMGVQSAVQKAGLQEDALQVCTLTWDECGEKSGGSFEAAAGYKLTQRLLEDSDVTGLICVNDMVAFGAVSSALGYKNIRIPQDISIVGFDNVYLSKMMHPSITSVDYCPPALCQLALDMLLGMQNSDVLKLASEPRLIERESSGPAPKKRRVPLK